MEERRAGDTLQATDAEVATHAAATRLTSHELVRQLISHLGPTLVATLADVGDRKLPHKWAKADGPVPRDHSLQRLQVAKRVWTTLSDAEGDNVARAWFIGANPRLNEEPPVACLRGGEFKAVITAATAFVEGLDD